MEHFFSGLTLSEKDELTQYREKYPHFPIEQADLRTNITPIFRPDLYKFFEDHRSFVWRDDEVNFDKMIDYYDYLNLSPGQQSLIKGVISFFSVGDKLINDNIEANLLEHIPYEEAKHFYRFKAMMEDVHATTYSRTAEHLFPNFDERKIVLDAVRNFPPVQEKVGFMKKYFNKDVTYPVLQIAEVCVEMIAFAGSFAIIYYFKHLKKFPAITMANELIARDEMLHGMAGACLYNKIKAEYRLSEDDAFVIISEAVETEKEFLKALLPNPVLGLTKEILCEYIEYVGNTVLKLLGYESRYTVPQKPAMLTYVNSIAYAVKNDFFNADSSQYNISGNDPKVRVGYSEEF